MLEINHVNLPRPHENMQVHIGLSFSFALPAVHCRTRYVGRYGGAVPHRVSPEQRQGQTAYYSTTNSPWYRWLGIQSINPSSPALDKKAAVKW